MTGFTNIGSVLIFLYFAYVIVLTVRIILDNKPPEVSIAWILAIFFLPYAGAVIYLLSGVNWKKKKIMKQLPEKTFKTYLGPILEQQKAFFQDTMDTIDSDLVKTINTAREAGNSILTLNNSISNYFDGTGFFEDLLKDLEAAEDTIHVEFFIHRSDELGRRIGDICRGRPIKG